MVQGVTQNSLNFLDPHDSLRNLIKDDFRGNSLTSSHLLTQSLSQFFFAKLSLNFNFNLVESWDSFIHDLTTPPNHPKK